MVKINNKQEIKIIKADKKPLEYIGECASVCWGSTPSIEIGKKCVLSRHDRTLEYPSITVAITGFSARAIRELYTHIIGVTRLQSSTRYINYQDFGYYTPDSIESNTEALSAYDDLMKQITETYEKLLDLGVPREDIANILPLGSTTTVVLKINLRALKTMSHQRLCSRALLEYRELMKELIKVVSDIDEQWEWLTKTICIPKCEDLGFCPELKSCGRKKPKASSQEVI